MASTSFFAAVGIANPSRTELKRFAEATGIPVEQLRYFDDEHKLPVGEQLEAVCREAGISELELMLRMGVVDRRVADLLRKHAAEVSRILENGNEQQETLSAPELVHTTSYGSLYQGDCVALMQSMEDASVDLIFADPPFNLNKMYPSGIDDDLKEQTYLRWCEQWLGECVRILKPGGSLFLWNLPKWNTELAEFLNGRLTFRHWIAVDIKYSLPIPGRLYPSHYSLLYYCKGAKPRTFHPDRLPMEICPNCYGDLVDYGGYKAKMNPAGVNLTDVWFDIPPVRHSKYKKREGANELAIQLLDRVIEMASDEGDLVFDPFGGAGTTYAVAEIKRRRWIGIEIGPVVDIIDRLESLSEEAERLAQIRSHYNCLFTPEALREREKRGLWTHESVRSPKDPGQVELGLL